MNLPRPRVPFARRLLAAALAAPLLLTACGDTGSGSAATSAADTANKTPAAAAVAPASAAPTIESPTRPAPELTLTLRGVADDVVEQGEPLRIAVRLAAPRDAADAFELAPATGSWVDAISVEIAPANGGAVLARAEAIGTADNPHATLDTTRVAGGLWRVAAATMQQLVPGDYDVRARLAITGGTGWTGDVVSDATPLQVAAVSESAERVAQRAINLAQDALLDGRDEEAAALLDAVLKNTPDDVRVLTVRGVIAERAGNPMAAMICVNRALHARSGTGTGLPPLDLDELQNRVMAALLTDPVDTPHEDPPAWTWPPAAVLVPPAQETPAAEDKSSAGAQSAAAPAPSIALAAPTETPAVIAPTSSAPVAADALPAVASAPAGSSSAIVVPGAELNEADILADSAGQWAATAKAGSEYGAPNYSAAKMTGAPNVPVAGDSVEAWCHNSSAQGLEWIELTYATPVHATEVRVRQTNAPGAIVKVEAIAADGTLHVWWEGIDPYTAPAQRDLAWFAVRVPATPYLVAKLKITLNLAAVPGWKEIDAVQLVGTAP
ncbi:MAG: hypothetical protein HY941_12395 [Gammaproteobacteria bacterium]|nr:hypothetical protein [Gammaproteobacteria bacterium]